MKNKLRALSFVVGILIISATRLYCLAQYPGFTEGEMLLMWWWAYTMGIALICYSQI